MTRTDASRYLSRTREFFLPILIGLFLIESSLPPALAQPVLTDIPAGSNEYILNGGHSRITFSIGHFFVSSTQGQFKTFDGRLSFDPQAPERGSVIIHINPGSIFTNVAARDEHLRSADFFDVTRYPLATFQSVALVKDTNATGKLIGTLSLHGVAKPITLNINFLSADLHADRLDFTAVGTLKRSDYGMNNYRGVIGDEVTLDIEAEFDRKH